jgi:predicted RNA-binding Zn-ribbon protein involved in translation (DUF1610 family)
MSVTPEPPCAVSRWEQRGLRGLTTMGDMSVSLGTPLVHVVCPQCHSPQRVRDNERYDPVCYLCPKCLHVWDTTAAATRPAEELQEYAPH